MIVQTNIYYFFQAALADSSLPLLNSALGLRLSSPEKSNSPPVSYSDIGGRSSHEEDEARDVQDEDHYNSQVKQEMMEDESQLEEAPVAPEEDEDSHAPPSASSRSPHYRSYPAMEDEPQRVSQSPPQHHSSATISPVSMTSVSMTPVSSLPPIPSSLQMIHDGHLRNQGPTGPTSLEG